MIRVFSCMNRVSIGSNVDQRKNEEICWQHDNIKKSHSVTKRTWLFVLASRSRRWSRISGCPWKAHVSSAVRLSPQATTTHATHEHTHTYKQYASHPISQGETREEDKQNKKTTVLRRQSMVWETRCCRVCRLGHHWLRARFAQSPGGRCSTGYACSMQSKQMVSIKWENLRQLPCKQWMHDEVNWIDETICTW